VPFIKNEEEKLQEEVGKLLGSYTGAKIEMLDAKVSAHCNRVAVEDGHTECVSIKLKRKATREEVLAAWSEFAPLAGMKLPSAPEQPVEFDANPDRPQPRLDKMRGHGMAATVGRLRECNLLDWKFVVLSHNTIRGAAGAAVLKRGGAGTAGQAGYEAGPAGRGAGMSGVGGAEERVSGPKATEVRAGLVVMKFGGTSVEDAKAMLRTTAIVRGRREKGLSPVVVVSAMAKVTDMLLAAAAAAGRGDKTGALAISARLRNRHIDTAAALLCGEFYTQMEAVIRRRFDSLDDLLRGIAAVGELTPRTSDKVVSYGERISSQMMAAALGSMG